MKMFLASYRFGVHGHEFRALASGLDRVAVVANAADAWPASARESAVASEFRELREMGLRPHELDLRRFFGDPAGIAAELDTVDVVWIRGGNTFVLRSALEQSGADDEIVARVRGDRLVYGGYSAGACVASPSLHGVELADDPADLARTTGADVQWDGLGLVDVAFVPHFGSVLDEDGAGEKMVRRFDRDGISYLTLTDEQIYLVDGDRRERIPPV